MEHMKTYCATFISNEGLTYWIGDDLKEFHDLIKSYEEPIELYDIEVIDNDEL